MDVFAANDLAAFNTIAGTPTEVSTAGTFDATYVSKGLAATGTLKSPQFINPTTGANTSLTDAWLHFDLKCGNQSGAVGLVELQNTSGVSVARIGRSSNNAFRPEYWNGASWVTTGTIYSNGASTMVTVDLHVVCGVSGSMDMYVNGTLVSTITGLNAAVTNLAFLQLLTNTSEPVSQILVSDSNTVGAKVCQNTLNANGANTAWTNDYTTIQEVSYNDATFISSSTLADKESYAASDAAPPAGYTVSSVWFAIRGRLNSGGSPANIKPLMRIGSTDYAGAYNFGGLTTSAFGASIAAFVNDPSTSAAWAAPANSNAAEVGFQTAA